MRARVPGNRRGARAHRRQRTPQRTRASTGRTRRSITTTTMTANVRLYIETAVWMEICWPFLIRFPLLFSSVSIPHPPRPARLWRPVGIASQRQTRRRQRGQEESIGCQGRRTGTRRLVASTYCQEGCRVGVGVGRQADSGQRQQDHARRIQDCARRRRQGRRKRIGRYVLLNMLSLSCRFSVSDSTKRRSCA